MNVKILIHFFRQVMEEISVNTSWNRDLTLMQQLTQAVLNTLEASGPDLLTPSDVLSLTRMIEMIAASVHFAGANAAEVLASIATNYVNVASEMLEPHMAMQWIGVTDDGVRKRIGSYISVLWKSLHKVFKFNLTSLTFSYSVNFMTYRTH